jgi:hypothetical protein
MVAVLSVDRSGDLHLNDKRVSQLRDAKIRAVTVAWATPQEVLDASFNEGLQKRWTLKQCIMDS